MDTITRMKAFVAVVENDGYSAAARKIGRSKALLSKYVRELEDELGALLINRTTRQLSLTQAGQSYYQSAVDILERLRVAGESVQEESAEASGLLRVTAPRSLGGSEAMLPLIEFAKAFPDIKLEVNLDDRLVDLVEERYDVAIRVSKLPDSSLIARRLTGNKLRYVVSPSFIERRGIPQTVRELSELPCIVDTNWGGRNAWPFLGDDGKLTTQKVQGVMFANDPEVCKRAAIAGLGVAMIPEFVITGELRDGSLVPILEPQTPEGNAFYAVYAHRRHVSTKVRVFVDFMADWFKKLG